MHVLKAASRAPRPARTVSGLDEYASTWPPVPDEGQLTRGGFPQQAGYFFKYARSLSGKFTVMPAAPACTT